MDQLSNLNNDLDFSVDFFDWYLFHLIVLFKPSFNCSSSFVLSWVDKVTTGTKIFVSVIANVVALVSLDNTFLSD